VARIPVHQPVCSVCSKVPMQHIAYIYCFLSVYCQNLHHPGVINLERMYETPERVSLSISVLVLLHGSKLQLHHRETKAVKMYFLSIRKYILCCSFILQASCLFENLLSEV